MTRDRALWIVLGCWFLSACNLRLHDLWEPPYVIATVVILYWALNGVNNIWENRRKK